MFALFNMLSRLVIAFLLRSKHLNFVAAITICSAFGALENKVCHCFHCFPMYLLWSGGTRFHDLSFGRKASGHFSLHPSLYHVKMLQSMEGWNRVPVFCSPCCCGKDVSSHSEDSQENLRLWTVGTPANTGWNATKLYSLHIQEVQHRQLMPWLSDIVGETTSFDLFFISLPFKAGRKVDRAAPAVAASLLGKTGVILKPQTSLGKNSRALREVRGSVLFHGLPWWLRW